MKAIVYLDGVVIEEPDGINELTQEIQYLSEYRTLFTYLTGDLEFSGDGYDALETELFNSPCAEVGFKLSIKNNDYFEGIIDVSDITYANISRGTIKTPIADNNISSYITKNAKIKTFINVIKTKNGEVMTAADRVTTDFFTPSTGYYDYNFANVYPVGDAFRYLVEWMSDNNLTCISPLFDFGGDLYGICIVNGKELASTVNAAPEISFFDLFTEMNKLFNIAMYVDFSNGSPRVVIDKYENIFSDNNQLTIDAKDVKVKFAKDEFFAKVALGSTKVQRYSGGTFTFPDATFLGFYEEEYFVGGQCNIDTTLNLVNNWVIDSNAIEDTIVNNNDSYDEDTFIVEVDIAAGQAVKYDNLIPSGFIYNLGLNNSAKSEYWLGAVPNDILAYLNNEANNFEATKNSVVLVTGNLLHPTEITDPGNNYDTVTGRYTCPIGGDGVYTFKFTWTPVSYTADIGDTAATVQLAHYNSGGTLIGTVNLHTFVSRVGDLGGTASGGFYLSATDYVRIEATVISGTTAYGFSTFSGDFADDGGVYRAYDPNDNKVYLLEFEVPLTIAQFYGIRDNITKSITIRTNKKILRGWVKSLKRNILTGMSQFILRTSNNKK